MISLSGGSEEESSSESTEGATTEASSAQEEGAAAAAAKVEDVTLDESSTDNKQGEEGWCNLITVDILNYTTLHNGYILSLETTTMY